ncbi:methyl-accepting chemotaxis protein [Celerinatantimonas yamalensis]|uniref:Methyl-accepting chemotaxis protein n=1 Tax=Celerinatantimonas yamalensis TaxID=559956 RepID=A0ABW9G4R8_9GAMM
MSLTLVQRIVTGFMILLMALLVLVGVNYHSLNKIQGNIEQITEQTIPLEQAANDSKISILQQNQILLSVFNSVNAEQIATIEQQFKTAREHTDQVLNSISKDQLKAHDNLAKSLDAIKTLRQQYSQTAMLMLNQHREAITINRQINDQLGKFSHLEERLNYYLSKYGAPRYDNPELKLTITGLSLEVKQVISYFNNYLIHPNIDQLKDNLSGMDIILEKRFEKIRQLDTDKGKLFSLMLTPLIEQLKGNEGLLNLYIRDTQNQQAEDQGVRQVQGRIGELLAKSDSFTNEAKAMVIAARDNSNKSIQVIERSTLLVSVIALAIAIITPLLIATRIRRSIKTFRQALVTMTNGDMQVKFDQSSHDEFSELGSHLNELAENLRQTFSALSKSSEQLSHVAERNAQVSEQTTQAVTHQRNLLESTASAMTQMESSVAEVAQRAHDTMNSAEQAGHQMDEVSHRIKQAITNIKAQAADIENASKTTLELNEYGQKIDSIIETIQNIAEQTNLLALNAAIEAARAGEQGRGFAVVADEVRSLASRTKKSTKEIQTMIELMQKLIQAVVDVIGVNVSKNTSNIEVAESADESLSMMNESIHKIVEMNIQIATATEEQSTTVLDISTSVVNISDAAEQTAQGAKDNDQTSKLLREQAQQQQQLISKFKV